MSRHDSGTQRPENPQRFSGSTISAHSALIVLVLASGVTAVALAEAVSSGKPATSGTIAIVSTI